MSKKVFKRLKTLKSFTKSFNPSQPPFTKSPTETDQQFTASKKIKTKKIGRLHWCPPN